LPFRLSLGAAEVVVGRAPQEARSPLRLVVASANQDKVGEIAEILSASVQEPLELLPRPVGVPEVEEVGESFLENARLKARALVAATGLPAVADDSGLEVDALGGEPGVRSARFAGPHARYADNVARLLSLLEGVEDRRARFRTVALVAFPDGREIWAEGTCEGAIGLEPCGTNGFGYDSVFIADGADGRSFAELSAKDKHALSSRGKAFRLLAASLASARA
jgi:XTP/dITP diphosphohydrolase